MWVVHIIQEELFSIPNVDRDDWLIRDDHHHHRYCLQLDFINCWVLYLSCGLCRPRSCANLIHLLCNQLFSAIQLSLYKISSGYFVFQIYILKILITKLSLKEFCLMYFVATESSGRLVEHRECDVNNLPPSPLLYSDHQLQLQRTFAFCEWTKIIGAICINFCCSWLTYVFEKTYVCCSLHD